MKKIIAGSILVCSPMFSMADTGAGCGLGATVFEGQSGLLMHMLAGTTNGVFGNQTFGMTSGTLGCDVSQPISVASFFIKQNKEKVALDFARGEGESLNTLASILQIEESAEFSTFVQENFASIYTSSETTGDDMVASLVDLMKSSDKFAKYAS